MFVGFSSFCFPVIFATFFFCGATMLSGEVTRREVIRSINEPKSTRGRRTLGFQGFYTEREQGGHYMGIKQCKSMPICGNFEGDFPINSAIVWTSWWTSWCDDFFFWVKMYFDIVLDMLKIGHHGCIDSEKGIKTQFVSTTSHWFLNIFFH